MDEASTSPAIVAKVTNPGVLGIGMGIGPAPTGVTKPITATAVAVNTTNTRDRNLCTTHLNPNGTKLNSLK
jgi:hypothetical protein